MKACLQSAFIAVLAFVSSLFTPSVVHAQDAGATPAPPVVVRWNEGLSVETADGANKFLVGTTLSVDGRFSLRNPSPFTDTFLMRRARINLRGRVSRYFEYAFIPDFAGGQILLLDAFIDVKLSDTLRIRSGKQKSPVGLEFLYSSSNLPFAERSLATNLAPARDVGIDARGSLFKGHLSYIGGIRNGTNDGANADTDTNNGKDLVGRATVELHGIGAAIGGSRGSTIGALPSFKTLGQQIFFSYAATATAGGTRSRVSPSVFAFYKWFGGYAEYLQTMQTVLKGTTTADVTNRAWNATAIVVLTGDKLTDRGPLVQRPFDPAKGRRGALQLAVRISSLRVGPTVFGLGLNAAGASQTAKAVAAGLVWSDTAAIKQLLTYEHTTFDVASGGGRKSENALLVRTQIYLSPNP